MADRRIELESKIAMLEHAVDTLGGELAAHQRTIDRLRQDVDALVALWKRGRGEAGDGGEPLEPHDTPPPHWGGRV